MAKIEGNWEGTGYEVNQVGETIVKLKLGLKLKIRKI